MESRWGASEHNFEKSANNLSNSEPESKARTYNFDIRQLQQTAYCGISSEYLLLFCGFDESRCTVTVEGQQQGATSAFYLFICFCITKKTSTHHTIVEMNWLLFNHHSLLAHKWFLLFCWQFDRINRMKLLFVFHPAGSLTCLMFWCNSM